MCRSAGRISWSMLGGENISRADISADYAKQAFVTVVPSGTTIDFLLRNKVLPLTCLYFLKN